VVDQQPSVRRAASTAITEAVESVEVDAGGDRHNGESSGADTRRRILGVALELFAVKGYAGTSIRDITEGMGLTKASLYYHFGSKEEILEAVTAPLKADFESLLELAKRRPPPDPEEVLTRVVDMLSRRIAMIRVLMGDPSSQRGKHRPPQEYLDLIAATIAADESPVATVRARCALGAAQLGAFVTASKAIAADPPFGAEADPSRTERILAGHEHLLTDEERTEIVRAALRALGANS
jgi:AcrR family transcriptional regulator